LEEKVIGILGGMGSYATAHTFKKILDKIDAKKEWDYPRIIIDNNPKLPSRVRAILYNERQDELVKGMCNSIKKLLEYDVGMIFIPCNTAHYFFDDIKKELPSTAIFNMITAVAEKCKEKKYQKIGVLASEGTIISDVYGKYTKNEHLRMLYPPESKFEAIRDIMEDVKQNRISGRTKTSLVNEVNGFNNPDCVVLACTELSVVWDLLNERQKARCIYPVVDALDVGINEIVCSLKSSDPNNMPSQAAVNKALSSK